MRPGGIHGVVSVVIVWYNIHIERELIKMLKLIKRVEITNFRDTRKLGQAILILEGKQELRCGHSDYENIIRIGKNGTLISVDNDGDKQIKSVGDMAVDAFDWDAIDYFELYDVEAKLNRYEIEQLIKSFTEGECDLDEDKLLDTLEAMLEQLED